MRQIKSSEIKAVRDKLLLKQGGKCAVCGEVIAGRDHAVLDHDHTSGVIRGVLHASCNQAEGRVKNKAQRGHAGVSPEDYIVGLGKYLEHHSKPRVPLIHPQHMTEDQKRIQRNAKARAARARKKKLEDAKGST